MTLPKYVDDLFVDLGDLRPDLKKHAHLVIQQILKYGNMKAIKWMFQQYTKKDIRKYALLSRELNHQDVSFWSNILEIPISKFKWISQF